MYREINVIVINNIYLERLKNNENQYVLRNLIVKAGFPAYTELDLEAKRMKLAGSYRAQKKII